VDRLRKEVMASAITHYQALALHKARRRSLRRLVKKHDPKCPRSQVLTLSQHTAYRLKPSQQVANMLRRPSYGAADFCIWALL